MWSNKIESMHKVNLNVLDPYLLADGLSYKIHLYDCLHTYIRRSLIKQPCSGVKLLCVVIFVLKANTILSPDSHK